MHNIKRGLLLPKFSSLRVYVLVKNGNGKSTRDNGNENGYFFMCAKTPIGRLTLVNFGARYGQFDLWLSLSPVSY